MNQCVILSVVGGRMGSEGSSCDAQWSKGDPSTARPTTTHAQDDTRDDTPVHGPGMTTGHALDWPAPGGTSSAIRSADLPMPARVPGLVARLESGHTGGGRDCAFRELARPGGRARVHGVPVPRE